MAFSLQRLILTIFTLKQTIISIKPENWYTLYFNVCEPYCGPAFFPHIPNILLKINFASWNLDKFFVISKKYLIVFSGLGFTAKRVSQFPHFLTSIWNISFLCGIPFYASKSFKKKCNSVISGIFGNLRLSF